MADPADPTGIPDSGGPVAIAITGPTASGKSALGLRVAERLGGEIVSMDSRQVYRGLDIGTAKPTPAERARVPHHGLDLIDPDQRYSAGRFARDARRWIREIRGRGRVPVLVGGTGFFLRALTHPLFSEPPLDPERRARLQRWLDAHPAADLRRWLARLDPESAAALASRGGTQRIARALEVVLLTGRTLAWWHAHAPPGAGPLPLSIFVLDLPRHELYRRIDERVHAMMREGLADEVRRLLEAGWSRADPGLSATGYAELAAALAGEMEMDQAVERMQAVTRRYARRQITWLRHQLPPDSIRLDATRPLDALAAEIAERWRKRGTS